MKLTPVIAALRARCPYFENRVAGAAQFKNLPEVGKLKLPAAYVVPGDDSPGENKSQTDYWQELKEGFSVVVILSNGRDERGQFASYDVVDDVRQMLFKALLGWNPEACGKPGLNILNPTVLPQGQTAVRKRWCCFRMVTVLMRWLLRCRTDATA